MNRQQTACPVRDKLSLNSGYILPSLLAVTDVLSCFCHLCWQLCLVQAALLQGSKSEVSIFLLCSVVQMCPCFFLCQPANLPSTPGSFCPDAHLTFTSFPERKHDHTVSWPPKIPCMDIVKGSILILDPGTWKTCNTVDCSLAILGDINVLIQTQDAD